MIEARIRAFTENFMLIRKSSSYFSQFRATCDLTEYWYTCSEDSNFAHSILNFS